jgi:uncharacterized protein YlxW (UPF0749 family)
MENRGGLGLLDHIAATALDDDYYVYRAGDPARSRLRSAVLVLALVATGLVATPAALQVRQQRATAELERQTLLSNVITMQQVEERNRAIVEQLRQQVSFLEGQGGSAPVDVSDLATATGAVAVHGPGVHLRIVNGPGELGTVTDTDLQILANGLWYAGAEAITIDGERLGTLSSVRAAGDAITVNFRSIRPPYDVFAIGDPASILARFDASPIGLYWEARRRRAGIGFDMTGWRDVVMPAMPQRRMDVTHAQIVTKGVEQ